MKKPVAGCFDGCLTLINYFLCMSSFLKKVSENTIWFKGINHSHLLNWVKNVLNSSSIVKLIFVNPHDAKLCAPLESRILFSFFFLRGAVLVFLKFCLSNTLTYFKYMNNLPQYLLVFEWYNFYLDTQNKQHETCIYLQHIFDMIDSI